MGWLYFTKHKMIDEGFTQKEMLIRILDKLEKVETRVNDTHELAKETNGKVKLHTKIIFGLCSLVTALTAWFVRSII